MPHSSLRAVTQLTSSFLSEPTIIVHPSGIHNWTEKYSMQHFSVQLREMWNDNTDDTRHKIELIGNYVISCDINFPQASLYYAEEKKKKKPDSCEQALSQTGKCNMCPTV